MYGYQTLEHAATERDEIILAHLAQVHLIARRIHERLPGHVSFEDLVSAGIVGLIAAVDNFNPSQNVQLKTYAEHKIRGAILDSLRSLDWAPRDRRKRAKQVRAAIFAAQQRLHREPDEEEIAAELQISVDEYRTWLSETQGLDLETLEYAPGDQEGQTLLRLVSDSEDKSPARVLERSELEKLLAEAIRRLPAAERTVLSFYYQEELSLREIAQILNVHLSRVSQLKAQAILRLRTYMERLWPAHAGVSGRPERARTASR
jgi:RNA polymerase sigma factor FliA